MGRPFSELEAEMTPEQRARSNAKAAGFLRELADAEEPFALLDDCMITLRPSLKEPGSDLLTLLQDEKRLTIRLTPEAKTALIETLEG